jgi:hypothetical protein
LGQIKAQIAVQETGERNLEKCQKNVFGVEGSSHFEEVHIVQHAQIMPTNKCIYMQSNSTSLTE